MSYFDVTVGTLWYELEPIVESILSAPAQDTATLVDCEENIYSDPDGEKASVAPVQPSIQAQSTPTKSG